MAEGKKSVLLYCDIIHTVEPLTDEEAGKLFKHYLRYINDLNPIAEDRLTTLLFEPIKQNLKRDLKKWEEKSERNSLIAKEGWEKRRTANAYEGKKGDAKDADKDTVTVKDKDKVKDILIRKNEFSDTLKPFLETYGSKMLNEFYLYWTEPTQDKKPKLKFELEKTWSLERRLSTWKNNENKFGNNQQQPNNSKPNYKRLD